MDNSHSPQAGPSRLRDKELHQGQDSEMQQEAHEDGPEEQQEAADDTADGDVLYYVDADGNPIDPAEMGEYALALHEDGLQQDGDQAIAGGLARDPPTGMDVDEHAHPMPCNESGHVTEHASPLNHSNIIAEQHEEQQYEEEGEEQHSQDTERYRRPFVPPPDPSTSNTTNDQAKTPDYAVKYTITGHRKNVSCIRFSPDGKYLITAAGDGRVLLYSLPKQSPSTTKPTVPVFIRSYTIPNPPQVKINSNQSANSIPPVGTSGINHICFSPNSTYFATASDDKIVRIWKIDNLPRENDILDESMNPPNPTSNNQIQNGITNGNGQHYLSGEENIVLPSSALSKSSEKPIELKGHSSFIFCVAFTPQGNLLASGSFDETVKIWDVKRGICLRTLPAHADPVAAVGFSGDGSVLCSAGHDGLLRLWDTATGQCLKSLVDESNPPASHALFTPNSRYILVSSLDSTIRLWDYHAAVCVKTYTGHKNIKYHIPALFVQPPKGQHGQTYILTGSEDGKVVFYDLQSRNIAFTLAGHKEAPILCLAHDPHSGMLASCALERGVKEHTVKLWVDKNRRSPTAGRMNGH